MMIALHPESLMGQLAHLPDPRRRSGRRYPLSALLGLVIIGMLNGQDSLHSAWTWAEKRWGSLWEPLGAHSPHFPAYNTLRDLLARLDADDLDRQLRPWMERFLDRPLGGISADGKVLRGSKRAGLAALHVVELVSHAQGQVLAQREAVGGDEVAALLVLLTEVPLAGRTISMDALLLTAQVTQTIQQQHGDYLGSVKGNQAEVQALLDDWLAPQVLSPLSRPSRATAGCGGPDCTATPQAPAGHPPGAPTTTGAGCTDD
jgi:hypothetical protein